jgi:hypothetical protein
MSGAASGDEAYRRHRGPSRAPFTWASSPRAIIRRADGREWGGYVGALQRSLPSASSIGST